MRVSVEKLPDRSALLRLHPDDGDYYTQFTVVKRLSEEDCELTGFVGLPDKRWITLAFKECKKLGYSFCHIERRKKGIKSRKIFTL